MHYDETWIKVKRAFLALLAVNSSAAIVLEVAALRAWRGPGLNDAGLKPGQAFVGDYEDCGLTEGEYRAGKEYLKRNLLITCKGIRNSNRPGQRRGTIITLLPASNRYVDINVAEPGTTDSCVARVSQHDVQKTYSTTDKTTDREPVESSTLAGNCAHVSEDDNDQNDVQKNGRVTIKQRSNDGQTTSNNNFKKRRIRRRKDFKTYKSSSRVLSAREKELLKGAETYILQHHKIIGKEEAEASWKHDYWKWLGRAVEYPDGLEATLSHAQFKAEELKMIEDPAAFLESEWQYLNKRFPNLFARQAVQQEPVPAPTASEPCTTTIMAARAKPPEEAPTPVEKPIQLGDVIAMCGGLLDLKGELLDEWRARAAKDVHGVRHIMGAVASRRAQRQTLKEGREMAEQMWKERNEPA